MLYRPFLLASASGLALGVVVGCTDANCRETLTCEISSSGNLPETSGSSAGGASGTAGTAGTDAAAGSTLDGDAGLSAGGMPPEDAAPEPGCDGCIIEGTCQADSTVHPNNPCLRCEAAINNNDWSANDGAECEDGLFCNGVETCDSGTCMPGSPPCPSPASGMGEAICTEATDACTLTCAESLVPVGDACLECDPSAFSERCASGGIETCLTPGTLEVDPCPEGTVCTTATLECETTCSGCLIGNVCYEGGDLNPGNPCEVCTPAFNPSDWTPRATGLSCSDGLFCNGAETCQAGVCVTGVNPCPTPTTGVATGAAACTEAGGCDIQCAGGLVSNGTGCVECVTDGDCEDAPVCFEQSCVEPISVSGLIRCEREEGAFCGFADQCCRTISVSPLANNGVNSCMPLALDCGELIQGQGAGYAQCDGPNDCPGEVCCEFLSNGVIATTDCRPAAECLPVDGSFGATQRVVCDPLLGVCPDIPTGPMTVRTAICVESLFFPGVSIFSCQ